MQIENEYSGQIIGCLLGVAGSLVVFCGVLGGYIWRRHVSDNDCKFKKNEDDHDKYNQHVYSSRKRKD